MVIGPDAVRAALPADRAEIDRLLRAAFGGPDESILVERLRADGAMWFELVLTWAGRIGAYAGVSRMVSPPGWGCLAPVGVLPEWQRGGLSADSELRPHVRLGSRIVGAVVTRAEAMRRSGCSDAPDRLVVLGEPAFYERLGFSRARAARLTSPFPISHTMIAGPGADAPDAALVYPPAFLG